MKKRMQERLNLEVKEVALIMSLILDEKYNDQMIQAIFSHLGRTINHRESDTSEKGILNTHISTRRPRRNEPIL